MNLLIIQARMGSTRLPGKVLMEINGKTILENLIDRVSPARKIDKLLVATTTNTEDDAIAAFCQKKGVACSRGSDWDVLDRFYQAAKPLHPTNIVRVTSDCPLHHHSVVDFVVGEYEKAGCDYLSNSNHEPTVIEDGFDTEVFSFRALEIAWQEAKMLSEREHVTPYIKNSGKFKCGWRRFDARYKYKLSVDSPNDFKVVAKIFDALKAKPGFGMNEVVELLESNPELAAMNKDSVANSGYRTSLDNDKPVK